MVDLADVINKLEPIIVRFSKFLVGEVLRDNLIKVLRTRAAPEIKDRLLAQYDLLAATERAEFGPAIQGKDPSALDFFRPLFESQLDRELQNIAIEGDSIVIGIGEKELLGFGREEPSDDPNPQSVDFLGYYVEGITGEYAFLTLADYAKNPNKKNPATGRGRFGAGFLISREDYEQEGWEGYTGHPFESVRHPISGQQPFEGFERALDDFDFGPFIEEAIAKTVEKFGEPE